MKKLILLATLLCLSTLSWGQKKNIKVACVGNSITYGLGLENREQNAYPAVLQKTLGKNYTVENFGKSGATLLSKGHRPYIQQPEYQQAIAFAADIVVIHLGINDTDPRNWPNYRDDFVADYLRLIAAFRNANPQTRVLIALMTPIGHQHPRFESGTRDWHAEIQQAIQKVAREANAQLIDFYTPLHPYPQFLPDAVHPNAEGAAILAKVVYSAITGNYGGLQMSPIYTDNMVLQHGIPLSISGIANTGTKIQLKIGHQQREAIADLNGRWKVLLDPLKAKETYTLSIIAGKEKLFFKNIIAGEVWLCSGQSNMEFMLREASTAHTDLPEANFPNIRFFDLKAHSRADAVQWSPQALNAINHLQYFLPTQWQPCTPNTAADFSAIAYYFAQTLQKNLDVPIGLICNAVGGSPIEAWIDRNTLENDFPRILNDWQNNDFVMDWVRQRASENTQQATEKNQRHPYQPAYLFETGIARLTDFPIKGVIWYQGESNAHNKDAHAQLFKLLVKSWRNAWQNPKMPFYYVQLSSIQRPSWGWFRDSQRRLLNEIPYSGMAVAYDQGHPTDVHPKNKRPIGQRLAYWALNKTYGKQNITPSGPLFKSVRYAEGAAFISFDYAKKMHPDNGKTLRGFELSSGNGLFYPATAEVVGKEIKVYSPEVTFPREVRYAFAPSTDANLVNEASLPAPTFTTER